MPNRVSGAVFGVENVTHPHGIVSKFTVIGRFALAWVRVMPVAKNAAILCKKGSNTCHIIPSRWPLRVRSQLF
jgi:hypothetical protein